MVVVTILSVLTATIIPTFASTQGVDSKGYIFTVDDDGYISYGYPIELDGIYSYDFRTVSFFDGSSFLYELEYIINQTVPVSPDWNQVLNDILAESAAGGAAVGATPGGAAGIGAVLSSMNPGTIVLGAFVISVGMVCLTQPDMVETMINDIYFYCDYNIQRQLDEIYFQDTWLIDESIVNEINRVISEIVTISDGVVWDRSIIVGNDGLTGYAEEFYDKPPVVNANTAETLTVEYGQALKNTWTSIDKNLSIVYKIGPEGTWNIDGLQRVTTSSQSGSYEAVMTIANTATNVTVKFYLTDVDGDSNSYSDSWDWYIAEPVFVNDGTKQAIEIVYADKKRNSSYYDFVGNTYNQIFHGSTSYKWPLQISGTGTVLDNQLITNITYIEDTGLFRYKYKPKNAGNADSIYKTVDLPMEPFHWVYSPTRAADQSDVGALDTEFEQTGTDEYGKIEENKYPVIPQIPVEDYPIPKPDIETDTSTDPDTGSTTITDTAVLPDIDSDGDSDSPSVPGSPSDPDNPDDDFKSFITDFFDFSGLFDWLPVKFSNALDAMIITISGFTLALVINKIVRG